MEDDGPIIYGLEFQVIFTIFFMKVFQINLKINLQKARTLTSQAAETENVSFLVGTQSLKFENQVHQLQYDEEHNVMSKNVFLHSAGELWHMSTSPTNPELLATCYNHISNKLISMGSCFRRICLKFGYVVIFVLLNKNVSMDSMDTTTKNQKY